MSKEVWYCEECQTVGCAELEPHSDVYSALYAISRSHRSLSPTCPVPVEWVRVLNTAMLASRAALDIHLPKWVVAPAAYFLGFE
ncbi:MAG: hypothetical protein JO202_17235 [Ktedonobacteraceae bacterium]|nr:hypothetical protein [Ktedonobacteraceae bacterium]